MKQFMDENFLLDTKTAQDLFHNHAAKMPIIDYHCHLIPEMVAKDHKFKREEMLANAPEVQAGCLVVPKTVE